ncbi:MAG: ABC transporter permease [Roseivirga sp.]|jgi:putative ABC transport system permease protein|uniref:ABC transporter permease n=1 Tax=Roseivirga sp. TaxID=1964215 RepID=UPI001AFE7CF3|nr:ABC transporter permease [Roseivirga sp.]MBO6494062.1 ABC transporter permease [Roseivirga sp.]MBO6661559.1 ABC transporter permease [Roseivirga sp.]MBO6908457.1 ABC transporter permease [Roseivirga sp.]
MNLLSLSWNYIKARPLNMVLNMLLMGLGIAIILVLILLSSQLEDNLAKNKKGVDLVVGAKGSPLQLILANVYHIDFPTGNIKLQEAKDLTRNRLIASAIPLALGDNYRGYRIVGTNHDYVKLFDAAVDEGELWKNNLDAVVGSNVAQSLGLKVGDTFFGAHGLSVADMEHEEMSYRIVGILEENNSVIDKLILTNIESVWAVHDHDEEHHEEHSEPQLGSAYETGFPEGDEDAEITSMLIKFRSPMGAVTLPRMINADTNMQAASPAFETQRLFSLLGIGVDLLKAFAAIIIIIAGLSIFISLYNALKDRKYDLAIMRSLGASKTKLFFHVVLEGVIITVLGGLLGFLIGHGLTEFLAGLYEKSDEIGLTGLIFVKQELAVMLISVGIGIIASLIPAINAYKTDISEVLAKE